MRKYLSVMLILITVLFGIGFLKQATATSTQVISVVDKTESVTINEKISDNNYYLSVEELVLLIKILRTINSNNISEENMTNSNISISNNINYEMSAEEDVELSMTANINSEYIETSTATASSVDNMPATDANTNWTVLLVIFSIIFISGGIFFFKNSSTV